jgi:hypothetical protein
MAMSTVMMPDSPPATENEQLAALGVAELRPKVGSRTQKSISSSVKTTF